MRLNKVCCFLIVLFVVLPLFAEPPFDGQKYYYYNDGIGSYYFMFADGQMTLYDWQQSEDKKEKDSVPLPGFTDLFCKVVKGNYTIQKSGDFFSVFVSNRKFLLLVNSDIICVLIDASVTPGDIRRSYWGVNEKYLEGKRKKPAFYTPEFSNEVKVSSFLPGETKGGILYSPPFGLIGYKRTWVEGVDGDGLGEWIELETTGEPISTIVLMNGLILPTAPFFYYKNNRIKEIKVSYDKREYIMTLKDTPSPQIIDLPEPVMGGTVKITILDVYKGTEYSDTSLSFFGFLRRGLKK